MLTSLSGFDGRIPRARWRRALDRGEPRSSLEINAEPSRSGSLRNIVAVRATMRTGCFGQRAVVFAPNFYSRDGYALGLRCLTLYFRDACAKIERLNRQVVVLARQNLAASQYCVRQTYE
jgi:hypothetical protein